MFQFFTRTASLPPVFVYTVHKAGSMFLHALCAEVAPQLGLEAVSRNDPRYLKTIDEKQWARFIDNRVGPPGCFGPIRVNPLAAGAADLRLEGDAARAAEIFTSCYWPRAAEGGSVVVHLRDPRDMLTSLYYSVAYSHEAVPGAFDPARSREPAREEGIDAFVLRRAANVGDRYRMIQHGLLKRAGVTLVRYEEMVTHFDAWLPAFLAGITAAHKVPAEEAGGFQKKLERIHAAVYARHRNDFKVEGEDILRHKRQIVPGDHRQKLQAATIERLNRELADVLGPLGYG